MFAIKPASDDGADEKLGPIGIFAGIGHGEGARAGVAEFAGEGIVSGSREERGEDSQVLIGEFGTVDRFSTPSIATGEVTALDPIGSKFQTIHSFEVGKLT